MTTIETNLTTQVYRVYIKADPQAIWDAITQPEWTDRYGYGGGAEYDMKPGGTFRHLTTAGMRAMGAGEVAIDGEVVVAHQPRRAGLCDDGQEELACHLVRDQPVAVLGENGRNEALFDHVHVEEPPEQQVVVELLAEEPLAAHGVERHQQHRFQKTLRRNRRPTVRRVHRVEHRRQLRQRPVGQLLDRAQRVRRRNSRIRRHQAQHRRLLRLGPSHGPHRKVDPTVVDPRRGLFQQPASEPTR